jgi:hypothetical protein
VANFLQDILDRSMAAADFSDEDSQKKKPKFGQLPTAPPAEPVPPWAKQASTLSDRGTDTSESVMSRLLGHPANPAYGANPMSSMLTRQKVEELKDKPPEWGTGKPNVPYQNIGGLDNAGMFNTAEPNPMLPRARPKEADPPPPTPLPRDRPPEASPREVSGEDAAIPPSAQPTSGFQGAGLLDGLSGFGEKLMGGLSKNSNMLMAMGAGLLGAPNLAQGMSRAASYAIPASQMDIQQQTTQGGQQAAFNALVTAGVPRDLAMAGATNPKIMDKLLESYVTGNKMEIKTIKQKNSWGEETEQLVAIDPRDPRNAYNVSTGQRINPSEAAGGTTVGTVVQGPNGQPVTIPTGKGGGGGNVGIPQKPSSFYAPGVSDENYRQDVGGDDYLAQFTPTVQAAIKDRVQGLQPAGRTDQDKRIDRAAELYGRSIGMPMDAGSAAQRLKYSKELTSEATNTAGGKARSLHQGLEHFVQMSDALVDMHLSGGMGLEHVAKGVNWVKSLSAEQQRKIARAQFVGKQLANEMGSLNSANGGGVHERAETAKLVSDAFGSRQKAAGALEGVVDIMHGGIAALERQRDDLFPKGSAPKGSEFMTKVEHDQLEHIRRNIRKLGGERPEDEPQGTAPAAAAPTPAGPAKLPWSVVQP